MKSVIYYDIKREKLNISKKAPSVAYFINKSGLLEN